MTAARGVSGDVSAMPAGRKAGREKAGQANEAEGFAAAMRGLGSPRDEKNAASVATTKVKPADRSPLHAGRQGDFGPQQESVTIDRGEGKQETKAAGRIAASKDEGAGATAEEGGVTAGRKRPARGASSDKPVTTLEGNASAEGDARDVGTVENLEPKAKAEATKGDGEAATPRDRPSSRTEGHDTPAKSMSAAKDGAREGEGARVAEATGAPSSADGKSAEPKASAEPAPRVETKGRQGKQSPQERILAERDPELRRLRILQSGVGAENPAVELQLSAEEVADRLGILLPGEVDENSRREAVPVPARSGRVIVTVGRGESYAIDPVEQDEPSAPAGTTAEARSSAPLSPDAKLAAILGGFGLESRIVAAIAAEPERRSSEIDRNAASAPTAWHAGGAGAVSTAATKLPNSEINTSLDGSGTAEAAKPAVPLVAPGARPGVTSQSAAEPSPIAASTQAPAGGANFVVPERGAAGASVPLFASQSAAAAGPADAAGKGRASATTQAAGATVDAARMTTIRLPEQPGASRPLGFGTRVDLVSMRTDFEPATRRSERGGGVGDAPAARTGALPVEAGSSTGAASARSVLAVLDDALSAGSIAARPAGRDAVLSAVPASSAGGERHAAGAQATGLAAGAETISRASAALSETASGATASELRPQTARQSEATAADGPAPARAVPAEAGTRRDAGDLPARQAPTEAASSAAATNRSVEPAPSRTPGSAPQVVTQTGVAASPDRLPALPADRPASTEPLAARAAKDGAAMVPASAEQKGAAAQIPARALVGDKVAASAGASDAVASKSPEPVSGGMPVRAEAVGTTGQPASRTPEPAREGRQMPAGEPVRPNVAREASVPTGRQAGAMVAAVANGAEVSRRGVDPIAAGERHPEAVTPPRRSRGPDEDVSASVARDERVAARAPAPGEGAPTRADATDAGGARHDARAASRPVEGSSPRNEPASERVSRKAPVAGQNAPAKASTTPTPTPTPLPTQTTAEGSVRGAFTATGDGAAAAPSESAKPAPAERSAQASPTPRIHSESGAAAMPAGEPRGPASRTTPVMPDAQPQAVATSTAPRAEHPVGAEPSQGMHETVGERVAEPLRPAEAATDQGPSDRGQRQEQQPRVVDRPAAAAPAAEPRGSASRAMPVAPGAQQPQATTAAPAAPRTDHPVAAEPLPTMQAAAGDPAAERLPPATPAAEPDARIQRPEQQARTAEKLGMPGLDDLARTKPLRQASSQSVRSEEGGVAASRQGMLSAPTVQVADALATALTRMDPAANAPAGADRTRLRAGGAALKTIQIQLAPEKLGKVNVTLKLIGDTLAVHIEATEPETAHRLKDDSEGLKSLLKSAGFDVDEAVITLGTRDAGGPRGAHQPGPQGDASANGQTREGSANGQFASDGQAGHGDRRDDGRPRRPQAQSGAGSLDGSPEAGGRNPGRDPSFYL
ncbi:flagellar hook-length control protein FliK [Jiella pacifica]|uniref:Flagellar hook-length control protein-like C-terminal domain-containing protein n=1 Tax=Jiella pacifica TaxID=2696469 RepID=A0A6N9T169_9HYPH|nr:flagellar hook-length control protein FliK [Jiella pacifica]NDW04881.1 hypothetical protein [Jiella pacifica]